MEENVQLLLSVAAEMDSKLANDIEAAEAIRRVYTQHNAIITAGELWQACVVLGNPDPLWDLPQDALDDFDYEEFMNPDLGCEFPVENEVRRVLREMTGNDE